MESCISACRDILTFEPLSSEINRIGKEEGGTQNLEIPWQKCIDDEDFGIFFLSFFFSS